MKNIYKKPSFNNTGKQNFSKLDAWWKPVMFFYVKTTAWVVFPLVLGLIAGQFTNSQTLFFIFLMLGFGITCSGIYKEIKEYKKTLKDGNK